MISRESCIIGGRKIMQKQSETVAFTLKENAVDFLRSAVIYVKNEKDHTQRLKYGLLHLVAGIELLLKYRLSMEHWSLVIDDIDKTGLNDINSGDFKSVGWQEAISRLEKFADYELSDSDRKLLDHLRKLRNRIQHFDIKLNREESISRLAAGLHFATMFMDSALGEKELAQEIQKELAEFQQFVKVRLDAIRDSLTVLGKSFCLIPCHRCDQDTLYADGGQSYCVFCGYEGSGESTASEWVDEHGGFSTAKGDMTDPPPIESCPECGATAFVNLGRHLCDETIPNYFCFACGIHGTFDRCDSCYGFFHPEDDMTICQDCLTEKIAKDD